MKDGERNTKNYPLLMLWSLAEFPKEATQFKEEVHLTE